ncbi:hypothetical protein BDV12DRAFT_196185 [Aspergillus spectabilis]
MSDADTNNGSRHIDMQQTGFLRPDPGRICRRASSVCKKENKVPSRKNGGESESLSDDVYSSTEDETDAPEDDDAVVHSATHNLTVAGEKDTLASMFVRINENVEGVGWRYDVDAKCIYNGAVVGHATVCFAYLSDDGNFQQQLLGNDGPAQRGSKIYRLHSFEDDGTLRDECMSYVYASGTGLWQGELS